MKTTNRKTNRTNAFTLIEMIGVLAVIAILAALLIPKVFQAITEARINTVPVGAGTVKTGVIDHYAKYGALNTLRGTNTMTAPIPDYDTLILLAEGFIDKPFEPRVGTTNNVILRAAGDASAPSASDSRYNLSGGTNTLNEALGTHVVEALIEGVPIADAQAISARIDGLALSQAEGSTAADLLGRVKYAGTNLTSVYIYLTHR